MTLRRNGSGKGDRGLSEALMDSYETLCRCIGPHGEGLLNMDEIASVAIRSARNQMEVGDYRAASSTLRPLVQAECAEALFLCSTFSVAGSESEDEFERRSFSMLARAAELGYVPAIYALAVCYESGDLVDENQEPAGNLFESAAVFGISKSNVLSRPQSFAWVKWDSIE